MRLFEYSLNLSTGERIKISEIPISTLDKNYFEAFGLAEISGVVSLCTNAPTQAMHDAKVGYTKPLEKMLRTPPVGALMKVDRPVCVNINDCAMADSKKCTARFSKFPECWEYEVYNDSDLNVIKLSAKDIVRRIAIAWRDGRYVIIVS